jgi:Tfp pilus assembly protein PilN
MEYNRQGSLRSIHGIRDMALMLSIGNAYLCDAVFLRKIGLTIDTHLKDVKSDISTLKKQYPGKFENEVEADQVLESIQRTARHLQEPDKDISKKCSAGELGRELEASVGVLAETVNAIRIQVEGELEGYTKKEAILAQVGRVKSVGHLIAVLASLAFKVIGVLVLVGAIVFSYLYFTMESDEALLKELDQSKSRVESQMKLIARLEGERAEVAARLDSIPGGELDREGKVEVMDLSVQIHKLDERVHGAEVQIDLHKRKIKDTEKRIAELKEKSFLQRLLRE